MKYNDTLDLDNIIYGDNANCQMCGDLTYYIVAFNSPKYY